IATESTALFYIWSSWCCRLPMKKRIEGGHKGYGLAVFNSEAGAIAYIGSGGNHGGVKVESVQENKIVVTIQQQKCAMPHCMKYKRTAV
ncbi:UNVERIFIED_CONTAM: hypothetical protein HDU68_006942, partial [Siphonaria sp. JEL0065]